MTTDSERALLQKLGACFGDFAQLGELHADDLEEFRRAIHAAQNIVFARSGMREMWPEGHPSVVDK